MLNIRLACRALARSPRFTLAALVALALGIGAATTVFSVADSVLFRALPYHDPDRLLAVFAAIRSRDFPRWSVPPEELDAWRASAPSLADLAGHQTSGSFTISLPDEPQEVAAAAVTPNFLHVLGVSPAIGRDFGPADVEPGAPRALLLTDAAWRRVFHADPAVVGRWFTVNGESAHVVGVLPREFAFPIASTPRAPEVLAPFVRTSQSMKSRLSAIGRLAPRATLEQARTELDALAASRGGESGLREGRIDGATVEPLRSALVLESRVTVMMLLAGAAASLLLIGCANVANLVVARSTDRSGELALRAALGASRGSLVRLLLVEMSVLGAVGGAAGIALAYWAVSVVNPLVPDNLKLLKEITVDGRALAVAAAASVLSVLLCGLLPAFRASRADVVPALNRSSSRATSGRLRARQIIVGLEVALAVVLLVGGALMTNAMVRLLRIDHGYGTDRVLTMLVQLPRGREFPKRSSAFVERTLATVRAVPGVVSASAMEGTPLRRILYAGHYKVAGFSDEWMRQGAETDRPCCTQTQWVSSDFFTTLGVPVVHGRPFTPADAIASTRVALISERLARKFPAGVDPIGHLLVTEDDDPKERRRILGVVGDVRDLSLEYRPMQTIYLPLDERGTSAMTVVMRTAAEPLTLAPAVRQAVQQHAGPVLITNVRSLRDLLIGTASANRLNAWLFGSFGALGLLLAAIGIYGVISYSVARRTREMGIRLALGASPGRLRWFVIAQTFMPVLAGLAAGVAASLALSRFVASLLYEVQPRDVPTYAFVCLVLCGTALAAAYLPARRASEVDPMTALHAE